MFKSLLSLLIGTFLDDIKFLKKTYRLNLLLKIKVSERFPQFCGTVVVVLHFPPDDIVGFDFPQKNNCRETFVIEQLLEQLSFDTVSDHSE